MIEINESNHASIANASLKKIYNQARIKGKLDSVDLYILDVLFKHINDCNIELTHDQKKKLQCIYRIIYNTSPDICKVSKISGFKNPKKIVTPFIVAESTDCPTIVVKNKIYYWQEPTPFTERVDIVTAIVEDDYLADKPFTTDSAFTFAIDIPLESIGRVAIAFNPGYTADSFIIKDILGNVVTHAFTRDNITSIDTVLFTSENVHSIGMLTFTVIDTPGNTDTQIFNNVFNNIFI